MAPLGTNFQRPTTLLLVAQDRFDNSRVNAMLPRVHASSFVDMYTRGVLKGFVGVSWTGATPGDRRRNKSQLVVINWNVEFAFRHGSGSLKCPSGKRSLMNVVIYTICFQCI